jgi:hypothetical protein
MGNAATQEGRERADEAMWTEEAPAHSSTPYGRMRVQPFVMCGISAVCTALRLVDLLVSDQTIGQDRHAFLCESPESFNCRRIEVIGRLGDFHGDAGVEVAVT